MKDIKNYIQKFKEWLKENEKAKSWEEERRRRCRWYKEKLSFNVIDNLTVDDFSMLIKELWASAVWRNKDYKIRYLIENNGFEKIKGELKELLYGKDFLEKRWDRFKKSIKGLGPSSISEILVFSNPREYPLINLKVYKVLPRLGISIDRVKDGKTYKEAVEKITKIKDILIEEGIKDVDFIITDFFVTYLFYDVFDLAYERKGKIVFEEPILAKKVEVEIKFEKLQIDSHESAEAVLLALGNLLGYETYTPDTERVFSNQKLGEIATLKELPFLLSPTVMESARNIDAIWVKDDWPEYFFEVEHSTGVTSGLLRIYRVAKKLSSQCFIIGPVELINRFKKEIEKPPFNEIKERYKFKSYEELKEMYLMTRKFKEVSDKFLEK